jgi:2-polyprenyl-3-methyl-5-hydroxy-6-metoxy-1,4-benzoquinol methylase
VRDPIRELLFSLNICDEKSSALFFPRVRDRVDIAVLRCTRSGVIFLSRSDHMTADHYESKDDLSYWGGDERGLALAGTRMDDERRSREFKKEIRGKVWLDVGTGLGGVLDLLKTDAARILAVEPQKGPRQSLQDLGYDVYRDVSDVAEESVEIATLFHVLEHFIDPVGMLDSIRSRLVTGGKIIVEVPHARDFLITTLDSDPFKAFTFWSEHLILHTRESLKMFLEKAGFRNIRIKGFQRYPLANHLYWLAKGKPGGHQAWAHLQHPGMDAMYAAFLEAHDKTDTLIAVAEK